jgi:hypothetical protein
MSTVVDFPPRGARSEPRALVQMEGPLNGLERLLGGLILLVEEQEDGAPCSYTGANQDGACGTIRRLTPEDERLIASLPSPTITGTLDTLNDLLRGLMALAQHNTDASNLQACHSLAREAHETCDRLRCLWVAYEKDAGKE